MYFKKQCIRCGNCVVACPNKAISINKRGVFLDRKKCNLCGLCTNNCFSGALKIVGKLMSVGEVFNEVMKDKVFYRNTGGGVTLSGGEVVLYPEFARELLKKIKKENIHTAIETCGFCRWARLKEILEYTDLVLYDIKQLDPIQHLCYTGKSNEIILDNLKKISTMGKSLIIRFPLIPGINDDENSINKIAYLAKDNDAEIQILPFHQFGKSKWYALGIDYDYSSLKPPSKRSLEKIKRMISEIGVTVSIGGSGN
jgi:pyruvate formate lyase activating enzyme